MDTQSDLSYDVIVVGGGNAALVSALAAYKAGARVVIFEAAPEAEHGGNSRFSSGIFRIPHGGLHEVKELLDENALDDVAHCRMEPYTVEHYRGDIERTSKGQCDGAQVSVMLKHAFDDLAHQVLLQPADEGPKGNLLRLQLLFLNLVLVFVPILETFLGDVLRLHAPAS